MFFFTLWRRVILVLSSSCLWCLWRPNVAPKKSFLVLSSEVPSFQKETVCWRSLLWLSLFEETTLHCWRNLVLVLSSPGCYCLLALFLIARSLWRRSCCSSSFVGCYSKPLVPFPVSVSKMHLIVYFLVVFLRLESQYWLHFHGSDFQFILCISNPVLSRSSPKIFFNVPYACSAYCIRSNLE